MSDVENSLSTAEKISVNLDLVRWLARGTEIVGELDLATDDELENNMNLVILKSLIEMKSAVDKYSVRILERIDSERE